MGSPTGILAERGDRGQCRNFLAALDDEGFVAKAPADRRRVGGRVLVSAGQ